MHRVDLDQPDSLLVPQKLRQGFHIRTRGLKTDNYFFKAMGFGCRRNAFPELLKAAAVVPKRKRFPFGAVMTPKVSIVFILAAVNGCNKDILIDRPGLFWFNLSHGYAPFFGLDYQLAQLVPSLESEYSLFQWA
jgi:hypothetical protein